MKTKRLVRLICCLMVGQMGFLIGCKDDESDTEESETDEGGQSLTIYTFGQPQVGGLVERSAEAFAEAYDVQVTLVPEMDFNNLMPTMEAEATEEATSGNPSKYDVFLVLNVWLADLVNLGFIEAFDPYIEKDLNSPELGWDDIPDGMKRKNSWGGKTWSMIVDNDTHFLHYRKDILDDPAWQDAYLAETGNPLPNPPDTLAEVIAVAEFFEGQDWDPDVEGEHGFVLPSAPGSIPYAYAIDWVSPHVTMPGTSTCHFEEDMTPLVNSEGYRRGVEQWSRIQECCVAKPEEGLTREDVISEFIEGKALMTIDWGDIGQASLRDESVLTQDQIGWAPSPGAMSYYDRTEGEWVDVEEVHRAPYHQSNGWAFFMTKNSRNKDLAWEYIKFASSPEQSLIDVTNPDGGFQPWRDSHSDISAWTDWDQDAAADYIDAILTNTTHENALFDVRIPGMSDYYAALEEGLISILEGSQSVEEAMSECESDWNEITAALGEKPQQDAYRAHLDVE
jgi:multiple sugar transport system substrate-binding protein